MTDLIIDGVSVNDLKAKRLAIAKGASKFISENMEIALADFELLKEVETKEEAKVLATKIYENLENINVVSGVSGVSFMLPYTEEYGGYDSDEVISSFLDDNENEALKFSWQDTKNPLYKLYELAAGMESDSLSWHSSTC